MATTIRSCDGDVLDTICYRHYGYVMGTVEAVLAANRGLAEIAQPYSAGEIIVLPDLPPPRADIIRLWS